jgi:hypothetical protein
MGFISFLALFNLHGKRCSNLGELKIDVSKLQSEKDAVEKLNKFIKERIGVESSVSGKEIILNYEEDEFLGKRKIKELIKKFLRREELDEDLRVVSTAPDTLFINVRK